MNTKFPPPRYRVVAGENRTIAGFCFDPAEEEVESILKIKSDKNLSADVRKIIELMKQEARDLVSVRAVYGVFLPENHLASWFPNAGYVALSLVTIGFDLEKRIAELESAGQVTHSLILDAWGSAFTEGAVRAIDRTLSQEAQILGCLRKPRRSPGYHPWKLESQSEIFRILPAESIQVSLTENLMMIPRKSVSFGVEFYSNITGGDG